jgi:hypothetical protein
VASAWARGHPEFTAALAAAEGDRPPVPGSPAPGPLAPEPPDPGPPPGP